MPYENLILYFCDQIKNSSAKIAFFLSTEMNWEITKYCQKSGVNFQKKYQMFPVGFSLHPNSDIYEVFDETFQLLMSSGIARYHHMKLQNPFNFKESKKEPKVLSCDDLSFGFIVWMVAVGISLAGFIFEISFEFILRKLKIFTKNFIGLYLIVNFLRIKSGTI